ncbi:MAG: ADP-ribosyltransferase [Sulfobacillus sp.]
MSNNLIVKKIGATDFLGKVLHVLSPKIVETLQSLPAEVFAVVVGGRAVGALVRSPYVGQPGKWDIAVVANGPSISDALVRDYVGRSIVSAFRDLMQHHRFRLDLIEDFFRTKILEVNYSPTDESGKPGKRVFASTDRYGRLDLVEFLPLSPKHYETIRIDGVNYLALEPLQRYLKKLLTIPGYPGKQQVAKRLESVRAAAGNDRLSCNYYRIYRKLPRNCVADTVFGPVDPDFPPAVRPFSRFSISLADRQRHAKYLRGLPAVARNTVLRYTKGESAAWNNQLNHLALFPGSAINLDPAVEILQKTILNAPPLSAAATVFFVNRFAMLKSTGKSNYEFFPGEEDVRAGFTSSSYDDWYDPRPFIDLFSRGVAYAVKVPAGSRVLIVGSFSNYPEEHELLFPSGSSFEVIERREMEVTYHDRLPESSSLSLWYDEMITYLCRYRGIKSKQSALPLLHVPKNEAAFEKSLKNPEFKQVYANLWGALGLSE